MVAVIPSGRQRTMSLLLQYLRAQRGLVDEVQMWQNTDPDQVSDREWIYSQRDDYCVVVELTNPTRLRPKQRNTGRFYEQCCTDPQTVYVRFDDDIVWMAPDAISNLVDCRLDNPEPFVVFATIWNNAIESAVQQELGRIGMEHGKIKRHCVDPIGWGSPKFGVAVHEILLGHIAAGTTSQLHHPNILLEEPDPVTGQPRPLRFSVSCFAFHGADFVAPIGEEEEHFIALDYPRESHRHNLLCGDALVSHYSFFTQRPLLDTTDILERYQFWANETTHDAYYRLLEDA